jgi:hypothetical protein
MPQDAIAQRDHNALGDAVVDAYLFVCNRVRAALQTHLGAQHTLHLHRQDVMALQESINLVCYMLLDELGMS